MQSEGGLTTMGRCTGAECTSDFRPTDTPWLLSRDMLVPVFDPILYLSGPGQAENLLLPELSALNGMLLHCGVCCYNKRLLLSFPRAITVAAEHWCMLLVYTGLTSLIEHVLSML